MNEIRKKSVIALCLALLLAIGVFSVCRKVEQHFTARRASLESALYQLPTFVPEVERERIQLELGLTDQALAINLPDPEALHNKIAAEVELDAKQKFPKGASAKALREEQHQLVQAKVGDHVKFNYITGKDSVTTVSGVYEMKEKSHLGATVVVGGKFYRLRRIAPEHRHLFDESDSIHRLADLSRNFKAEYERKRTAFIQERRQELEQKIFAQTGYVASKDGKWLAPKIIMEEELARRKKNILADRDRRIKEILAQYYFMGVPMFKLQQKN